MWASVGLCVWKTREGDFQGRSVSGLTPRASASSVGFKNTRFYSETTPFWLLKRGRGARGAQRPSWRRRNVKWWIQPELSATRLRPAQKHGRRPAAEVCCLHAVTLRACHTHARAHTHVGWWKVPSVRRQLSGFAGTGGCCKGGKESELMK